MRISNREQNLVPWLHIAVLLVGLVILYIPVFSDLIRAWLTKPHCSHGFLVLPIAAFLVWSNKDRIGRLRSSPSTAGLALIGLGMFLYLVGSVGQISTLSNLSLLLNIVGIVWALAGKDAVAVLSFPVCYLIFMFPIPDFIYVAMTNPLKLLVTKLSVWVMHGMGMTVYREGNILLLPNVTLEVVEGCSGLRSLMAYVILATLLAYFLPRGRWAQRVILVVSTLPLAIVCNSIRVILTGILADRFGGEMAEGFYHELSGFLLFFLGYSILLGIFLFFKRVRS